MSSVEDAHEVFPGRLAIHLESKCQVILRCVLDDLWVMGTAV